MSTRSATIIKQTTCWGEQADTEELMRFYRHCDGYPEGHGIDMARAVVLADKNGIAPEYWVQGVLEFFFCNSIGVEFEPHGCEHGDLEYLYVVEGIIDHRWGKTKSGKLPITISVYDIVCNEDYDVTMEREPLFSGTAYEYVEKYGKE